MSIMPRRTSLLRLKLTPVFEKAAKVVLQHRARLHRCVVCFVLVSLFLGSFLYLLSCSSDILCFQTVRAIPLWLENLVAIPASLRLPLYTIIPHDGDRLVLSLGHVIR